MRFAPNLLRCYPPKGLSIVTTGGGDGARPGDTPLSWEVRKILATYTVGSGSAGPLTVQFFAHNPSPRLRWSITIGWELTNSVNFSSGAGAPTWQMKAIRRSSTAGVTADLNNIFTSARSLPDGYELDSAVKDVRGTVVLNNTDLATGLSGNLVAVAYWEPNGVVDPSLYQLIQTGDLTLVGSAPNLQNTS